MKESSLYSSYVAICVFNLFSCYTAITLNSVTIHAIRKTSSMPKTLKILLLSLAVSDLCVGVFVQPLYIACLVMEMEQNTEKNAFYDAALSTFYATVRLFAWASFFGVMALSADRFTAVYFFLSYKELVTHKRVAAVVISIWLFSAFLSLMCFWMPVKIVVVVFVIISVACEITATFLTFKIYWAIKSHINQLQAMDLSAQQVIQNGELVNVARLRRFGSFAVYVYLVFMFSYLPHTCFSWVITITSEESTSITVFSRYTLTLVLLNSSLNPLIYCWKMKNIRHAVMDILRNVAFGQR